MREILTAVNIAKSYDDKKVIENINITLNEGELVSILGISGVGKTTLFNVLSGLTLPDRGTVMLHSNSVASDVVMSRKVQNNEENLREKDGESVDITGQTGYLAYMLQKDMLLPHKTIVENAALPLLLEKVPKKKALEIAESHFEQFGLEGTPRKYPNELSGGMRQRVALLRTYLCGKSVALLDEPFSALDTITRSSMQQWYLDVMKDIKLSTFFITHDMDEAIFLSDRIYIMKGDPATITDEIVIDEKRPRDSGFELTEKFLEYKKRIMECL